jgi:hypothetical protein
MEGAGVTMRKRPKGVPREKKGRTQLCTEGNKGWSERARISRE